jgi:outer membrane protein TolC
VGASVHVPLFEGGNRRADISRASALLAERNAEAADVDAGIRFEVESAILDLQAAAAGVEVAKSAQDLAQQELEQAQDRFRAGIASSIELVQAQESVARASEDYITSVYAHNIAKAGVARALGEVEDRFLTLVGGAQ